MNETTTNAGVAAAPENGQAFALHLSDEELERMRRSMDAVASADVVASPSEAQPASETPTQAPPSPAQAAPPKWEPSQDPCATPEHMMRIRPLFYLWTIDAMEHGAYQYEVSEGVFEKRYRAIDGLVLGRVGRAGDGTPPVVAFWLYESTPVSDRSGRFVEGKKGYRVHVALNEHLREILPMLDENGAPHVRLRPLGYETLSDGRQEMRFEMTVEPDPVDPSRLKLVPLATVLGAQERG
jgi:hypothetical protein